MTQWEGSVFQFIWIQYLVAISLYTLVLTAWYVGLRDADGELRLNKNLMEEISLITSRFQAAISLMLGFYTSALFNRWWQVRTLEGVVIGRINDLSVQIAALVRDKPIGNDTKDDTQNNDKSSSDKSSKTARKSIESPDGIGITSAAEVRMNLVRWLNLAHALAVGDLYEKRPQLFSSLDDLLSYGLLSQQEYEYLDSHSRSRYQAPFVWFLNLLDELKDKNYCGITDGTLIIICGNVTRIRGSMADLFMFRNVPVPLSYRQLVNWTVRVYLVMFAIAGAVGSILHDDGSSLGGLTPSVFYLLVPFSFEFFMFVGWLSLADALGNPFRAWKDEFEYENYVKSVALSSNQWITAARGACTPLSNIEMVARNLESRLEATLAQWDQPTKGRHESLREKLTGFE